MKQTTSHPAVSNRSGMRPRTGLSGAGARPHAQASPPLAASAVSGPASNTGAPVRFTDWAMI